MDRVAAGRVVARLNAHWPSLASNDTAAKDWVDLVARMPAAVAEETADVLIATWARDRVPRVGDWQAAARSVAARHAADASTRALLAGPDDMPGETIPSPERAREIIAELKVRLASRLPASTRVRPPRSGRDGT